MKKFRIGVFGGIRGTSFTACEKVLGDQMEIVALCEKNPEVVSYDKEKNYIGENVKIYTDFDEFIHSGLDAVVLCNNFYEHAKYAIKAMEAGVPVLSETTAGVSLGDCIDLVEAYERTGTKYMLGANCIFFKSVQAMKKAIKEGKIGDIVYGDAEYVCPPDNVANDRVGGSDPNVDIHNLHWRNTLPRAYYNMHDMGPLMYISETRPKRVIGKPAATGHRAKPLINYDKFYSLVEMENGVVFNYAGGTSAGSESKWYRVAGTDGTVESVRYDKSQAQHIEANKFDPPVTFNLPWGETGAVTPEEEEKYFSKGADGMSHGGVDLILFIHFLRYLRDEEEPFFNVYRAVDLSATGIMAWYSALSGSRQLDIPDFRTKEAREKFRGDYRHPFAKDLKDITLPCEYSENSDFQIYLK